MVEKVWKHLAPILSFLVSPFYSEWVKSVAKKIHPKYTAAKRTEDKVEEIHEMFDSMTDWVNSWKASNKSTTL
jgi:hypothetical protein